MLQQTQVRTVLPYYDRFLRQFPDIRTLAEAPETAVLAAWAGLGYYSRARNLQRAARVIAGQHEGEFPRKLEDILKLPGVGRYTAGAIVSIAFNQPQPVVDGNVRRVMSRLHGLENQAARQLLLGSGEALDPSRASIRFQSGPHGIGRTGLHSIAPPLPDLSRSSAMRSSVARNSKPDTPAPLNPGPGDGSADHAGARAGGRVLLARQRDAKYIPGEWGLPTRALRIDDIPERAAGLLARKILRRPVHSGDLSGGAPFDHLPANRHSRVPGQLDPGADERWLSNSAGLPGLP